MPLPAPRNTFDASRNPVAWISADVLSGCAAVSKQLGIDVLPHLLRHGFDAGVLLNSAGLLPFAALADFLEDVARTENCPDFGFRLGREQQPMRYGILSQLPTICPDIGSALRTLIRFQQLYSQSSCWELICEGEVARVRRLDVVSLARAKPQLASLSVTLTFKALRALTGPDWRPISGSMDHESPAENGGMRQFFGAPLFANSAHNEIAFQTRLLLQPIPTSNPPLLEVLTAHFERLLQVSNRPESLSQHVARTIRSCRADHRCSLETIAERLGMHPRTLQRALIAEGTTFRTLLASARLDLAVHLLRLTSTPISDISALLGYAHVSGFSRAFEAAKGYPPSRERRDSGASALTPLGASSNPSTEAAGLSNPTYS